MNWIMARGSTKADYVMTTTRWLRQWWNNHGMIAMDDCDNLDHPHHSTGCTQGDEQCGDCMQQSILIFWALASRESARTCCEVRWAWQECVEETVGMMWQVSLQGSIATITSNSHATRHSQSTIAQTVTLKAVTMIKKRSQARMTTKTTIWSWQWLCLQNRGWQTSYRPQGSPQSHPVWQQRCSPFLLRWRNSWMAKEAIPWPSTEQKKVQSKII